MSKSVGLAGESNRVAFTFVEDSGSPREVLQAAAQLVRQGWVQGYSATTEQGENCLADAPEAAAWCLIGALLHASYKLYGNSEILNRIFPSLVEAVGGMSDSIDLVFWNDRSETTKEDVVNALETAALMTS